MAERSTLTEATQIGMEVTPGTAVAATRALKSWGLTLGPSFEYDTFRPSGSKFATLVSPTKDWTEGTIDGRLTYDELIYLLSMNIGTGTMVVSGVTGKKWTFQPNSSAPDTPLTATVERGSSVRSGRAPGLIVPSFEFTIDRDAGCTIAGSAIARAYEDGIVLTAGATAIDPVPVLVGQVNVYMDPTFAAIGTTKLTRCRRVHFTFGSRFAPVWVLDRAQGSWVASVETEPTCELEVTVEADATGMGLLPVLRAGSTRHLRVEALGAQIGAGPAVRSFKLDLAGKVSDGGSQDDDGGLTVSQWTFTGVADATAGRAFAIEVINDLAAL
jgi:hypothetical protein